MKTHSITVFLLALSTILSFATVHATPVAGGAGKALWFDHERSDVLGIDWQTESLNDLTVEFWMKVVDHHLTAQTVLALSEYDVTQNPIYDNPDGLQIRFRDSRTCLYRTSCSSCRLSECQFLPFDDWVHFALSWDSATGNSTYYRNGEPIHTAVDAGQFVSPLTSRGCFLLGHEPDEYCGKFDENQAFDGLIGECLVFSLSGLSVCPSLFFLFFSLSFLLCHFVLTTPRLLFSTSSHYLTHCVYLLFLKTDEFRLWDHVRTAEEIHDSYQVSVPTNSTGLNIYYSFDDDTLDYIPDLSGNNNRGLLGQLPTRRQVMQYSTPRGAVAPTAPHFVSSTAPMAGPADIEAFCDGTNDIVITLFGFDHDAHDLITRITVVPSFGTLHQVDGDAAVLATNSVNGDGSAKQIIYRPSGSFAEDTFTYSVEDDDITVSAVVHVKALVITSPLDSTVTISEDAVTNFILGGINSDGATLEVVITALPSKGQLYQANFGEAVPGTYSDIPTSPADLVAIDTPNTVLTTDRGIVVFIPDADDYDDSSVYTSFTYTWRHPTALTQSTPATVSVNVVSTNDAPTASPQNTTAASSNGTVITLSASDVDTNFAERNFFYLSSYPKFGKLYQVDSNGEITGEEISHEQQPPTVITWASEVLETSSQYTRCNCFTFADCPTDCPDGSNDYHATNILGSPDYYPSSGDSPKTWSFADINTGPEYIVVRFPNSLFIESLELYETQAPGAVVRIATTQQWTGNKTTTTWTTLWSGETQSVPDVARIFEPSVCPLGFSFDVLLVEMDAHLVSGWNEYDALKLVGTLTVPTGLVTSVDGKVAYVPDSGIHAGTDSTFDSFSIRADDCESISATPSEIVIGIEVDSTPTAAASMAPWRHYTFSNMPLGERSVVTVNLTDIVANLDERGITVSNDDISNAAITVMAILGQDRSAEGTIHQGSSVSNLGYEINPPAILDSPSYVLDAGFGDSSNDGDISIILWVQIATYTYRIEHDVQLECPYGFYSDLGNDDCVLCRDVPLDARADFSDDDRQRFDASCVDDVESSAFIRATLLGVASVAVLLAVVTAGAIAKYRTHPVIRYSSPTFLYLITLGGVISYSNVFVLYPTATVNTCHAIRWTFNIGFACVFGPLFAKTHRLAKVFNNKKLKDVRISDGDLLRYIGLYLFLYAIYLTTWTLVDPPYLEENFTDSDELTRYYTCEGENALWGNIPVVVNLLILLWGVYLCVVTRNNPSAFNESKYIAISLYNLLLVGVFVFPLVYILQQTPDVEFVLKSAAVLLTTTTVLSLLFIPKFYAIYTNDESKWDTTTPTGPSSKGNHSGGGDGSRRPSKMKPEGRKDRRHTGGGKDLNRMRSGASEDSLQGIAHTIVDPPCESADSLQSLANDIVIPDARLEEVELAEVGPPMVDDEQLRIKVSPADQDPSSYPGSPASNGSTTVSPNH